MHELKYITKSGKEKSIRFVHGNISSCKEDIDLLICSTYIGHYAPVPGTMIHSLLQDKGVSVYRLAQEPQINLRPLGGWLSAKIGCNIKRLACIELLDWNKRFDNLYMTSTTFKRAFSTMRYLVEQAALNSIPVRSIVLPLIGCGQQELEPQFIVPPLLTECLNMIESIDDVQHITFYEMNVNRLHQVISVMEKLISPPKYNQDVFISYNSKNLAGARHLKTLFQSHGLSCWMAPDSIPTGSSYLNEISQALQQISAVALFLTPEAEQSRWVPKEIGVAISRGIPILPCQMVDYPISNSFRFLLEGIQIFKGWEYDDATRNQHLIQAMRQMLPHPF